jgi:nucleoside-diphosphate-sugar epimerase
VRGGGAGVRFAAARLGSVYGPWEYATGVRDTLSPMLQVLGCALRDEEAVLGSAWCGDFVYSRDVADGLVRLVDAPALSRVVYNLGSGVSGSAESWCKAVARCVPEFRWRRTKAGEAGNIDSHTGFHRGPMAIEKIARDAGYAPQYDFATAAEDWWQWLRTAT